MEDLKNDVTNKTNEAETETHCEGAVLLSDEESAQLQDLLKKKPELFYHGSGKSVMPSKEEVERIKDSIGNSIGDSMDDSIEKDEDYKKDYRNSIYPLKAFCKKRCKIDSAICGKINIKYGEILDVQGDTILTKDNKPICVVTSQNSKDYFYCFHEDGTPLKKQLERHKLIDELRKLFPVASAEELSKDDNEWRKYGDLINFSGLFKWQWNDKIEELDTFTLNNYIHRLKKELKEFEEKEKENKENNESFKDIGNTSDSIFDIKSHSIDLLKSKVKK